MNFPLESGTVSILQDVTQEVRIARTKFRISICNLARWSPSDRWIFHRYLGVGYQLRLQPIVLIVNLYRFVVPFFVPPPYFAVRVIGMFARALLLKTTSRLDICIPALCLQPNTIVILLAGARQIDNRSLHWLHSFSTYEKDRERTFTRNKYRRSQNLSSRPIDFYEVRNAPANHD